MEFKKGKIAQQIIEEQNNDGKWDLGSSARDNLYFPLSDSWRKKDDRKDDCTKRISAIMKVLKS